MQQPGLLYFLLACNVLLPCIFVFRWCVSKQGIEINHVFMFTAGFLVYWTSPLIIGLSIDTSTLLGPWSSMFRSIPTDTWLIYLLFSFGFYTAFASGTVIGSRIRFVQGSALIVDSDIRDVRSLTMKLRSRVDPLSRKLYQLVPIDWQAQIDSYDGDTDPGPGLSTVLRQTLNRWLLGPEAEKLAIMDSLPLSSELRRKCEQRSMGDAGLRVYHAVLQENYPEALRRRISVISVWNRLRLAPTMLLGPLLVGLTIGSIYAFILRNSLFHGYDANYAATMSARGTLSAVASFLLALAFVYMIYCKPPRDYRKFIRGLINPFVISYFVLAVLCLSLGYRLYFVSSVFMFLIYRSVYYRKFSARGLLMMGLVMALCAGLVGASRLGNKVTPLSIVTNLLFEPMGTSITLMKFLADGKLELLNFPKFLLTDFLNLIPSFLLPSKQNLLLDPEQFGYHYSSVLGAMHSAISFMVNFGMLGTLLFIFCFAVMMAQLKRSDVRIHKVMYIMISGWLGLTFFRDAFMMSIVKSIFEFSILVPLAVAIFANVAHTSQGDRGERTVINARS